MPTLQQMVKAFEASARTYDIHGSGHGYIRQRDLLPIAVLVADLLLSPGDDADGRPFICAAGMLEKKDRKWVVDNLVNATHYPSNNMVDVCAMRGSDDPYETIITMESEGWSQNAANLVRHGARGNAALWDLYKLLQVPSPCRVFLTRSPQKHHAALLQATASLAASYEPSVVAGDLFAIQIPTANLGSSEALFARWASGEWGRPPENTTVHLH